MVDNTHTDHAFFREVDEELRYEKMHIFWKTYRWLICASLLVLCLFTGGFFMYKRMQNAEISSASGRFVAALDYFYNKNSKDALKSLEQLEKKGPAIYQTLAKIQKASIFAEEGNKKAAIELFDIIAKDEAVDPMLRDVAKIRSLILAVDTSSYKEIKERLEKVSDKASPLYLVGQESLALSAWKENKMQDSYKILHTISLNPSTPVHVRRRSRIMLDMICSSVLCESF